MTSAHTTGNNDIVTLVGYGRTGTGVVGDVIDAGIRRAGENVIDGFDGDGGTVGTVNYPASNHILMDFDQQGSTAGTLGSDTPRILEYHGASGDSGGPWYGDLESDGLGTRVIAIMSYGRDSVSNDESSPLWTAGYGDVSGAGRIDLVNNWINAEMGGVNWNTRGTSGFSANANWGDGVIPTGADVRFSLPTLAGSTPTVTHDANNVVRNVAVEFGRHFFDMNNASGTTDRIFTATRATDVSEGGQLVVRNGMCLVNSNVELSNNGYLEIAAEGRLNIQRAETSHALYVGNLGENNSLQLQGGRIDVIGSTWVGFSSGSIGNFNLSTG